MSRAAGGTATRPPRPHGATLRLTAWTAGLVLAGRLLLATGAGTLAIPLGSVDDLSRWTANTDPAEMVVAVARLAALAAVGHLLAVTVLAVGARAVHAPRLGAAVDRVTPALVRRLLTGGSWLGLAVGTALGGVPWDGLDPRPAAVSAAAAAGATDRSDPAPAATMTRNAGPGAPRGDDTATMTREAHARGTARMTRVEDTAPPDGTVAAPAPTAAPSTTAPAPASAPAPTAPEPTAAPAPSAPAPSAAAPAPAAPEVDPTSWVIEQGDSLWRIAEEVVGAPRGGAAPARDVERYWVRLVTANRDRLLDPANPDLLVPGHRLVLPSTAA